jgi:hypothetical protein
MSATKAADARKKPMQRYSRKVSAVRIPLLSEVV